jgi:hypothetical protein
VHLGFEYLYSTCKILDSWQFEVQV